MLKNLGVGGGEPRSLEWMIADSPFNTQTITEIAPIHLTMSRLDHRNCGIWLIEEWVLIILGETSLTHLFSLSKILVAHICQSEPVSPSSSTTPSTWNGLCLLVASLIVIPGNGGKKNKVENLLCPHVEAFHLFLPCLHTLWSVCTKELETLDLV